MVGCAAKSCTNSSAKGFIMKVFPTDPIRRAEWAKGVGRKGWTPTSHSSLCEVHFTPEMWERRADNKPKLKLCAVPTIFKAFNKQKTFLPETENTVVPVQEANENRLNESIPCDNNVVEHSQDKQSVDMSPSVKSDKSKKVPSLCRPTNHDPIGLNPLVKSGNIMEDSTLCHRSSDDWSVLNLLVESSLRKPSYNDIKKTLIQQRTKIKRLKEIIQKKNRNLVVLQKQLKTTKFKQQLLQDQVSDDKYKKALCEVFTEDQIKVLLTKKTPKQWSSDTILRALKLKLSCGTKGYEQVQQQKIPVPDLRTIRRVLEKIDFKPNDSNCTDDFLEYYFKYMY